MEPIPSQYAIFHIIPNSPEESADVSFPKNVGEAVMFFNRLRLTSSEANSRSCMSNLFDLFARGPDGRTQVAIAQRSCICWNCGRIGLPANTQTVEQAGDLPIKGVCMTCVSDEQTNLVYAVQPDGSMLPWIEVVQQQQEE